jgi:hypothetical protein
VCCKDELRAPCNMHRPCKKEGGANLQVDCAYRGKLPLLSGATEVLCIGSSQVRCSKRQEEGERQAPESVV